MSHRQWLGVNVDVAMSGWVRNHGLVRELHVTSPPAVFGPSRLYHAGDPGGR